MLGKAITTLALTASLGVTLSLAGASASTTSTGGWTNTNANAADSRANLAEKVLTPAAVLKVKYVRTIASPLIRPSALCPGPIVAPLLAGGSLYAMTNDLLSKYDPATGKLIWRANPNPLFTENYRSLAISGGLVIVGGSGCGSASVPGGLIKAFNASTGALIWTGLAPSGLNQAVTVGTAYVVAYGADAEGTHTVVLNLKNGTLLWHSDHNGCYNLNPNDPVVVGLMVMREDCDNQGNPDLEALNIATGAAKWSLPGNWQPQRGDLAGSAGSHLYARNPSGTVVDLNPLTGHRQYSLSGAVTVLAVDATGVYATCGGSVEVNICAYSISTGARKWRHTVFSPDSVRMAAEADGVLYLDAGYAMNAATGQVIKRLWFPVCFTSCTSDLPTALAVGDGRIAVVGDPRVLDLFGLPGS